MWVPKSEVLCFLWPRRGSEFVDRKLEEGASELKLGER